MFRTNTCIFTTTDGKKLEITTKGLTKPELKVDQQVKLAKFDYFKLSVPSRPKRPSRDLPTPLTDNQTITMTFRWIGQKPWDKLKLCGFRHYEIKNVDFMSLWKLVMELYNYNITPSKEVNELVLREKKLEEERSHESYSRVKGHHVANYIVATGILGTPIPAIGFNIYSYLFDVTPTIVKTILLGDEWIGMKKSIIFDNVVISAFSKDQSTIHYRYFVDFYRGGTIVDSMSFKENDLQLLLFNFLSRYTYTLSDPFRLNFGTQRPSNEYSNAAVDWENARSAISSVLSDRFGLGGEKAIVLNYGNDLPSIRMVTEFNEFSKFTKFIVSKVSDDVAKIAITDVGEVLFKDSFTPLYSFVKNIYSRYSVDIKHDRLGDSTTYTIKEKRNNPIKYSETPTDLFLLPKTEVISKIEPKQLKVTESIMENQQDQLKKLAEGYFQETEQSIVSTQLDRDQFNYATVLNQQGVQQDDQSNSAGKLTRRRRTY
jgi:hypothetical protein